MPIMGGAGSAVLEYISEARLDIKVTVLGIPDAYIEHATQEQQWSEMGIDAAGIKRTLQSL